VTDDGGGIEAEILPLIFERFQKGRDGNHGIGLAIVKSIADQHKGAVTAENLNEGGAKFTLTLPA
jgi:signal transduction histidine kinase